MGALPDMLPGYDRVDDAEARKRFEERWGSALPAEAGLTAIEMIERAKEGKVKGMYIVGENPALSFPNSTLVRETLEGLDFLVVQDMFLTDTAKLADVVLPVASFAEKEGTFTNFEGRVQRLRKVVEPAGEVLTDSEIVLRLAEKMGKPMPYSSVQQIADEIEELVPLFQSPGDGDSEARDVSRAELNRDPLGRRRLYKGQFPKGFSRFSPVEYRPQPETARDGYAFTLLSGGVLHHSGTGSKTSRSARLNGFTPDAYVELCRPDADRIGVSEGDRVKVISSVGEVTAAARLSAALPEGIVFMPNCFPSTPVNELFEIALDPKTMTPALKACPVNLEGV